MVLADFGAEVVRVDRASSVRGGDPAVPPPHVYNRSRRSIGVDLKHPEGVEAVLRMVDQADGLIEGFRPGVTERLGLGPDVCLARNPRLVYGRMTGWGQDGPYAPTAGHDINYIALAGALHGIGRHGQGPVPPLNLIGDFGGGGMLLALGVCAALVEAGRSGRGQVVDAAMVDGASLLAAMFSGFLAAGSWSEERGTNMLDTGAPWYDVYETKDGKYVSIGAIEERFFQELLSRLNIDAKTLPAQHDRAGWPEMRATFSRIFKGKTRDEWRRVFEGSDACFAPVLSWSEARRDPHNVFRNSFLKLAGVEQPGPAPRFSRTPSQIRSRPPERGEGGIRALADWGFDAEEVKRLRSLGLGFREK
jgi:alpha-methylacyl-CoA racemase